MVQARQFDRYREPLVEARMNHAVIQLYKRGVINPQRVGDVLDAYETPPHDWGGETAWRLFNGATFALAGYVAEDPSRTRQLHTVIDGVCEAVN